MSGGNDALDARAVTAALTHIVKEKALLSKDMGIRDENIEEAAVSIPEDVIEELEALREPPRKPPNSQEAYDLHYPKPELLSMLATIVTFFEKAIKYLPRTKILETLQLTVEPYHEDSPLLDCPEGVDKSHARKPRKVAIVLSVKKLYTKNAKDYLRTPLIGPAIKTFQCVERFLHLET
ncbi:hypothetical protein HPB52_011156 [Rhipicephalus sanguineus]|uniref:Uncharacterized protein n=1 Tax=Rhipicephalus sanguineus TaxID=34632 RepID=A0A9D4SUD3_RHISA|nr:hypothetical protein HPB52_011156 [Rhipicephalus sanguineus]